MHIRLGTRGSKLALVQTQSVIDRLRLAHPEHTYEAVIITTKGDVNQHQALHQIGDKGLFVSEIEEQIRRGEIEIGVHSMKDMPAQLGEGLCFTRCWLREDPRDALVLKNGGTFQQLPPGATLATGSKRRVFQLLALRPDLKVVGIRGNVDTRLRKMEEGPIDGLVMAAAGLHRLGLSGCISQYFAPDEIVPACAQGALALEIRQDREDLRQLLDSQSDPGTDQLVGAERAFLAAVGGSCHIPIGAYAWMEGGQLCLRAVLGREDGSCLRFAQESALPGEGEALARELAARLKAEVQP